jgi:MFS family permease
MTSEAPDRRSLSGPSIGSGVSPTDKRNAFTAAFLGWTLDGFETYTAVIVGHQVVATLVAPNASALYFAGILAVTLAAWAVGGLLSGVLTDYFGRRRVLMIAIVWYALCTGLSAIAPNYGLFIVFRFLTGLGIGAEWGPGAALVSEMWSNRTRGRGIAFLQGGFGVGFLLATAVWSLLDTSGPNAWRYMFLVGVLPALLVFFIRRYVKDPQMWVDADERRREARARSREGRALTDDEAALTRFTVAHLFADPTLRARILKLLVLALATLGGWWAVSTWVPQFAAGIAAVHHGNPIAAATSAAFWYNLGGIAGYFAMGFFNDFFGRRKTLWAYFLGSLVLNVVLFGFVSSPGALPVATFVNGFFTLGMITWIATWPVELFPTHARGTAISIVFNLTRFLVVGATLLSGLLVDLFGSVSTAALVIGCIYVVGLLFVFWTGPETKGQPLPD